MANKQLGAFYTPPEMARLLTEWAVRSSSDKVFDPGFGEMVFLEAAAKRMKDLGASTREVKKQLHGIEFDRDTFALSQVSKIANAKASDYQLSQGDFFRTRPLDLPRFDAVIGNPPYVRYQNVSRDSVQIAAAEAGVELTKLASLWAPFVAHTTRFLAPGGRLAQVLPAELLFAQYAKPIQQHLKANFEQVTLLAFVEAVFPGAQEEILLLFCEGYGGSSQGIEITQTKNLRTADLSKLSRAPRLDPALPLFSFLSAPARRLYSALRDEDKTKNLGEIGSVDIGLVTGANKFFVRSASAWQTARVTQTTPILTRAQQAKGARFMQSDLTRLRAEDASTDLWTPSERTPTAGERSIILAGEQERLDQRYKCRIRDPWWRVPFPTGASKFPDAFLTYMSDTHPRLILNNAKAFSTNTIHGVRFNRSVSKTAAVASFYNSLTLLSAELVGRSYGGGILKLEPTEAEKLVMPPLAQSRLAEIDRLLRTKRLDRILDITDALVLGPLGITESEIHTLRVAREQLLARRQGRRAQA